MQGGAGRGSRAAGEGSGASGQGCYLSVFPGQALTVFQRSLTTMQSQVASLLQFAVPVFPTAEVRRLPPAASVLGAGTPPLDLDNPPAACTSPSSAPGASRSRAEEAPPWPLCPPGCPRFSPQARPCCSLSASLHVCLLQKDLLGIQLLLNSSESGLHQLTAMLDCRGLHKVPGRARVAGGTGYPGRPHVLFPETSQ